MLRKLLSDHLFFNVYVDKWRDYRTLTFAGRELESCEVNWVRLRTAYCECIYVILDRISGKHLPLTKARGETSSFPVRPDTDLYFAYIYLKPGIQLVIPLSNIRTCLSKLTPFLCFYLIW